METQESQKWTQMENGKKIHSCMQYLNKVTKDLEPSSGANLDNGGFSQKKTKVLPSTNIPCHAVLDSDLRITTAQSQPPILFTCKHDHIPLSRCKKKKNKNKKKGKVKQKLQEHNLDAKKVIEQKALGQHIAKEKEPEAANRRCQSTANVNRKVEGTIVSSGSCHNLSTFSSMVDILCSNANLLENTLDVLEHSATFHGSNYNRQTGIGLSLDSNMDNCKQIFTNNLCPNSEQAGLMLDTNIEVHKASSRDEGIVDANEVMKHVPKRLRTEISEIEQIVLEKQENAFSMENSKVSAKFMEKTENLECGTATELLNDCKSPGQLASDGEARQEEKNRHRKIISSEHELAPVPSKAEHVSISIKHNVKLDSVGQKRSRIEHDMHIVSNETNSRWVFCGESKEGDKNSDIMSNKAYKKKNIPERADPVITVPYDGFEGIQKDASMGANPEKMLERVAKKLGVDEKYQESLQVDKEVIREQQAANKQHVKKRKVKKKKKKKKEISGHTHCNGDERNFTLQEELNHDAVAGLEESKGGLNVFEFASDRTEDEWRSQQSLTADDSVKLRNLEKISSKAVRRVLEDDLYDVATCSFERIQQTINVRTRADLEKQRKLLSKRLWSPSVGEFSWEQSLQSGESLQLSNTSAGDEKSEQPITLARSNGGRMQSNHITQSQVACPTGCGRLYSKKTSAFYRHKRQCLGKPP